MVDQNRAIRYPPPVSRRIDRKVGEYRLSIITADKATRRVLAPYVRTIRRSHKLSSVHAAPPKEFSYYLQRKPSALLRNLSAFLTDSVDLPSLLHETSDVLKNVTKSNGVILYMVDQALDEIFQHPKNVQVSRHRVNWQISTARTVATYVAHQKEYVISEDILSDPRFPDGVGWRGPTVKAVLCVPVVTPDGDCIAIIELYRDCSEGPYAKSDLQIVVAVTGWMGAAIHQNQQRLALQKQQELNDYLLDLTKCYFADIVLMDKIISEIVNFAKATLGAERGSFFIIDPECDELVADLFDEGIPEGDNECAMHKKKMKIRFSKDVGIAGLVAKTGITVNIKDAYNDPRFNKEVDLQTGFITRSIICMPINGRDGVLGVVQLVNKKGGSCFTNTDENLFKTFSVYCALALNYARLQQNMRKMEMRNNVHVEMLLHQMRPCVHDKSRLLHNPGLEEIPEGFLTFAWYHSPGFEDIMNQLAIHMLADLVTESTDDASMRLLSIFVLTVRKNYRSNPYHNWDHAFNVCHCMYNVLKRNMDIFSPLEIKALIVAGICHDLDHPGLTNNFLMMGNTSLAQLYPESPLENHHFQVTMQILNSCKLFAGFTPKTFKDLTQEIHDAIIATDLALYFRCRTKLLGILTNKQFDWTLGSHRVLLKGIMMTSCDLSGQCKPFPVAKRITECLYREFYHQGDIEKELGMCPLSMMDREKQHVIPDDQVQFITVVVLPCIELLWTLLPNTEPLLTTCKDLREHWKEVVDMRGQKVWKPEESIVHFD